MLRIDEGPTAFCKSLWATEIKSPLNSWPGCLGGDTMLTAATNMRSIIRWQTRNRLSDSDVVLMRKGI